MEIIIAALATWQIIEIWHHSLLFASWRSTVENWTSKLGELLVCPFCLSPWTALICTLIMQYQSTRLEVLIAKTLITALAVSRLANLGNDCFYSICRTPRFNLNESESENV